MKGLMYYILYVLYGILYFLKKWISISLRRICQQIWQAGTSGGVDSNETNQAGAGDAIMSRLVDKLKTYIYYQGAYGHQTRQDSNLPWWASSHNL